MLYHCYMSNTPEDIKKRIDVVSAIRYATTPEKTGIFCFDGFEWYNDDNLLLFGDHGTPDFELRFEKNDWVEIIRRDGETFNCHSTIDYENLNHSMIHIVRKMRELSTF